MTLSDKTVLSKKSSKYNKNPVYCCDTISEIKLSMYQKKDGGLYIEIRLYCPKCFKRNRNVTRL